MHCQAITQTANVPHMFHYVNCINYITCHNCTHTLSLSLSLLCSHTHTHTHTHTCTHSHINVTIPQPGEGHRRGMCGDVGNRYDPENRTPPPDPNTCLTNASFCEIGDLSQRLGFLTIAGEL